MDPTPLDFRELADLRLFLLELRDRQVESLRVYYDDSSGGFYHRHDNPTPRKPSRASTATCVLSLIATNEWQNGPWHKRAARLVKSLLKKQWQSAGLDVDNVFTVGFIYEAVSAILGVEPDILLDNSSEARLAKARLILKTESSKGALRVQGYPPSAYVTQLVVRSLRKQGNLTKASAQKLAKWAEHEIIKQIALLTGNDKTADVFQLAYSLILLVNLLETDSITTDQEFSVEAALAELFRRQRDDGTWQLSRPLFHYPSVGSAHCYDYEMLVQLLSEARLTERLLPYIPKLAISARVLKSGFPLGAGGTGWSSGHHPQFLGPESWSTASVYHFVHAFERLIAEQIRRATFSYLSTQYAPPRQPAKYKKTLEEAFLDCKLKLDGKSRSLKKVVSESILSPLIAEETRGTIESGRRLSKETPVSIIFYGPPGTSKTNLAAAIARLLGWPLLSIDASQFLKNGMDGVYAEADRIFGMLAVAERILVLLDEFDEMVRAREEATDVLSRFLTTAMLPKLNRINDNRRLVFIVATNHIEEFDVAIRRPGRFDAILQVMPPKASEKLRKWEDLWSLLSTGIDEAALRRQIEPLTYTETEILTRRLGRASTQLAKRQILDREHEKCTLLSSWNPTDEQSKKWIDKCHEQSVHSRVL
jgi:ATPase family protein associated with various cellular activities (AAA)